jgi:hypothetical protein
MLDRRGRRRHVSLVNRDVETGLLELFLDIDFAGILQGQEP